MTCTYGKQRTLQLSGPHVPFAQRFIGPPLASRLPLPVMDEMLNALQWPAMVVTLAAAWLVGGRSARRRTAGFWVFVLSNVLWCIWGLFTGSYALIVLQGGLFVLNLRGVRKNKRDAPDEG